MASVSFLNLGATIQAFRVGDRNIVLGFPTPELYVEHSGPFFGQTVGRVANRIAGAQVTLNGKTHALVANEGTNTLHGGKTWGLSPFEGPTTVPAREEGHDAVQYKLVSPDGDSGFPGTVELLVTYTQATTSDANGHEHVELEIEYEAQLVGPADVHETAINITNHSYFNLSDFATIEGTTMTVDTDQYLVVDDDNLPTGAIATFPGIRAHEPFTLGATEPDVDHCFVLPDIDPATVPLDTRASSLHLLVAASHPTSHVHLEVWSTEPAFQLYTGAHIDVPAVAGLPARGVRSGFAIEPSRYVNAINMDAWRPQVLLPKGKKYGSRIVFRAWTA